MKPKTISIATLIIIAIALLLILASCSKEEIKPTNKIAYSFFVTPIDHSQKLQGVVYYGINHASKSTEISANGFGTSVELSPGESLVVSVDTNVECYVYVGYKPGEQSKYVLVNGEALTFER